MSAAVPAAATDAVPVHKGKKKTLIVILAGLALLLVAGGGATAYLMHKRAAAAAEAAASGAESEADEETTAKRVKADLKHAPTFVALDPFTVNLADREAERFAQVGISLELTDAKAADLLKAYMPAIRNNILLTLGGKTAAQLSERDGKLRLAAEIRREALRPLGYDIVLPELAASGMAARKAAPSDDDDESIPVRAVHFSNFIIQ
jgi:flagellar FliL protein